MDANKSAFKLFEVELDEFIGHEIGVFIDVPDESVKRAEKKLRGVSVFFTTRIEVSSGVKELEIAPTGLT